VYKKAQNIFLIISFLSIVFTRTPNGNLVTLNTIQRNQIHYVSIQDFAEKQNLNYTYYESKEKFELKFHDKKIYFSPHSSYFKIDDKVYHMVYRTLYINKVLYVPIKTFLIVLDKESLPIQLAKTNDQSIQILTDIYNIHNLNIDNKKNGTAITFKTSRQFFKEQIATSMSSEGWLNITILGGQADSLKIKKTNLIPPVIRSHIIQSKESTQISLLMKNKVDDLTISTTVNQIKILLHTEYKDNVKKIEEIRKTWTIDTIVLDAGHGGKDPGAIGINKLQEKTVTLDIAKHLTKLLEKNLNIHVINTRDEDIFIPLWKRTEVANQSNGDLFISIHANSTSKSPSINGFETFLLRVGKTSEAIEVAKRENSVIEMEEKTHKYQDITDAKLILATMSQNSNMKASEDLASLIQENLDQRLTTNNRGVKQAGFHVLVGASMPNVLIEVGFLSNKNEATKLGKSSYRREIARAIFEAILDFKSTYEKQ